jgi:CysZ protein
VERRIGLFGGVAMLGRALALVRDHPGLRLWWVLPAIVNGIAFFLAGWVFLAHLDALAAPVQGWLSVADPSAWYEWLWVGPLRLLAWLVRWILLLVFAVAVYLLFTVVGGVIASPILDMLSERVETVLSGRPPPAAPGWGDLVRASARSVLEEGKRSLFFLGIQLILLLFGLIPGLQLLALAASVIFAALFLPLDYTGYVFDRRTIPFRVRRAWVMRHRKAVLGFGLAALGTFLVPGLNFLCLPWLVTAGTCLAVELGIPGSGEGSRASAQGAFEQGAGPR